MTKKKDDKKEKKKVSYKSTTRTREQIAEDVKIISELQLKGWGFQRIADFINQGRNPKQKVSKTAIIKQMPKVREYRRQAIQEDMRDLTADKIGILRAARKDLQKILADCMGEVITRIESAKVTPEGSEIEKIKNFTRPLGDAVRAADSITKNVAQECKILGLEAPRKVEIETGPIQVAMELPREQRLKRIAELSKKLLSE